MNFLVGIHIKDYNGTPNKKGGGYEFSSRNTH